jgi:hypothetical protein
MSRSEFVPLSHGFAAYREVYLKDPQQPFLPTTADARRPTSLPICCPIDTYDGTAPAALPASRAARLAGLQDEAAWQQQADRVRVAQAMVQRRATILNELRRSGAVSEVTNTQMMFGTQEQQPQQDSREDGSSSTCLFLPSVARRAAGTRRGRVDEAISMAGVGDEDEDEDDFFDVSVHHQQRGSAGGPTFLEREALRRRRRERDLARLATHPDELRSAHALAGFAGPCMHLVTPSHTGAYQTLDPQEVYLEWRPRVAVLRPKAPRVDAVPGEKHSAAQANSWFLGSPAHYEAVPLAGTTPTGTRRERARRKLLELRRIAQRHEAQRRGDEMHLATIQQGGGMEAAAAAAEGRQRHGAAASCFAPRELQFMAMDPTHQVSASDGAGHPAPMLLPGRRKAGTRRPGIGAQNDDSSAQPAEKDVEHTRFMSLLRGRLATALTTQARDGAITEFIMGELRFIPPTAERDQLEAQLAAEHPMLRAALEAQRKSGAQKRGERDLF